MKRTLSGSYGDHGRDGWNGSRRERHGDSPCGRVPGGEGAGKEPRILAQKVAEATGAAEGSDS